MNQIICLTCAAIWCLLRKTTEGACDGGSSPSDVYFTTRGTVAIGTPCCFPFTYKGLEYSECTIADNPAPWCSTDKVYEATSRWGVCIPRPETPGGACIGRSLQSDTYFTIRGTVPMDTPCCFPFYYKGQYHHNCINQDHSEQWCSVSTVYHEENKLWGSCVKKAATTATTATTTTSTTTTEPTVSKTVATTPLRTTGIYWNFTQNTGNGTETISPKKETPVGLIAGIVVAVVVISVGTSLLILYFCSRKEYPKTLGMHTHLRPRPYTIG